MIRNKVVVRTHAYMTLQVRGRLFQSSLQQVKESPFNHQLQLWRMYWSIWASKARFTTEHGISRMDSAHFLHPLIYNARNSYEIHLKKGSCTFFQQQKPNIGANTDISISEFLIKLICLVVYQKSTTESDIFKVQMQHYKRK